MEEKERFIFIDLEEGIELIDTENKTALDDADKIKDTLNQQDKENKQLKQQLAEKEKELAEYTDINNTLNSELQEKCILCEEEHNQDKISFAVEQLTLLKNTIVNKMNNPYSVNIKHILSDFDNQINELKEMR